ncbi:ankyrin repeat-containing domain protein, partial [Mycena leptocephala]
LRRLIQKGANPNLWSAEIRFGNALQLVAYHGKAELVKALLQAGASPNTHGGQYGTALCAACANGKVKLINALLQAGASPNADGGDYGTALCAACASGRVEVVNALLQAGARRNGDGEHILRSGVDAQLESGKYFGAPLHVAVLMENREMVELLVGDNPNDANCTCG